MKLLLDTCVLLHAASGNISKKAQKLILDADAELYFSSASIWEVVIKNSLGRKDFKCDPTQLYYGLFAGGYLELPISALHVLSLQKLLNLHKDPFDRIILAQALTEKLTILTEDKTLAKYPIPSILVWGVYPFRNK